MYCVDTGLKGSKLLIGVNFYSWVSDSSIIDVEWLVPLGLDWFIFVEDYREMAYELCRFFTARASYLVNSELILFLFISLLFSFLSKSLTSVS